MTYALLFPGQGSQIVSMGKELFLAFSCARDVFEEVDESINQKLSSLMFEGPLETLSMTANTQPALLAVSIAVTRVLEKVWEIPISFFSSIAGHSLGEYTALCAAGSLSLKDAARLLRRRGELMQKAAPFSGMVALLGGDITQAEELCKSVSLPERVCVVANDNAPGQVVLSGHLEALSQVSALALEKGFRKCIPLNVSAAFHSPLMKDAQKGMEEALDGIHFNSPSVPVYMNVLAAPCDHFSIKQNLLDQVTGRVRFRETLEKIAHNGSTTMVEAGPGKVVSGLVKRCVSNSTSYALHTPQEIESFVMLVKD